jgi:hypothetical protein
MTLKGGYLKEIYKQLDNESQYIPAFDNGNVKYVASTPKVMQQQLLDDGTKA